MQQMSREDARRLGRINRSKLRRALVRPETVSDCAIIDNKPSRIYVVFDHKKYGGYLRVSNKHLNAPQVVQLMEEFEQTKIRDILDNLSIKYFFDIDAPFGSIAFDVEPKQKVFLRIAAPKDVLLLEADEVAVSDYIAPVIDRYARKK